MAKVILFSGGVDSALLVARNKGEVALFFNYGQEALDREIEAAFNICSAVDCRMVVQKIPKIEKHGDVYHARNFVLIAHATAYAVKYGCNEVLIGCAHADKSDFPDCRSDFLCSLSNAMRLAYGVTLWAPLLYTTRAQIVEELAKYKLPNPWSCYTNQQTPCGECKSCKQ